MKNLKCSACGVHTDMYTNVGHWLESPRLSIYTDRQQPAIAGTFGKRASRANPMQVRYRSWICFVCAKNGVKLSPQRSEQVRGLWLYHQLELFHNYSNSDLTYRASVLTSCNWSWKNVCWIAAGRRMNLLSGWSQSSRVHIAGTLTLLCWFVAKYGLIQFLTSSTTE